MTIAAVEVGHYRIPLPAVLSDSTHGELSHFELVTARVRAADGGEGVGYTYTVGTGGSAIAALIRDLVPLLAGQDADRIEALWARLWWGCHYVGRGGLAAFAISAVDVALWGISGRAAGACPSGSSWAATRRGSALTRAASTSSSRSTGCCGRRRRASRGGFGRSR
jgi:L-alanine-DL-glutamate epimerase-like enolase superfamily enzyme